MTAGVTHRLFFALWPDDATRDRLAAAARTMRERQFPTGRWTPPSKFHITLQFLGGYPVWPDEVVTRAMAAAAELAPEAFTLRLDRASSFGKKKSSIWWIGPGDTPPELTRLNLRLRDALRRHAVPHERGESFVPHVTVLRDAERVLAATPLPTPVEWTPDMIVLACGTAPGTGQYDVLARWPIRPAPPPPPSQARLFDPV